MRHGRALGGDGVARSGKVDVRKRCIRYQRQHTAKPGGNQLGLRDRYHGQAGVHTSTLPAPTTGFPQSFTVDVYTGPAGSLDGSFFVSNGLQLQDGTVITPVGSDTTGPAEAIDPLQNQYEDFNNDPLYEYAAAPFDVTRWPLARSPWGTKYW